MVKRLISATVLSGVLIAGVGGAAFASTQPAVAAQLSPAQTPTLAGARTHAIAPKLARVAGVVTAVNGSSLTVVDAQGTPRTVTLTASTAITPNTRIVATGTLTADGTLTATRIRIRVAHSAGTS